MLQLIAYVHKRGRIFDKFIADIIRITTSEVSNECTRQVLTSPCAQVCTAEQMGEVEFLDINHYTTTEYDFGFVTKDFVKPSLEAM